MAISFNIIKHSDRFRSECRFQRTGHREGDALFFYLFLLFSTICAIMPLQKNKRRSSGELPVVGRTACDRALGDKGIAVKVRGNSHYRNSRLTSQVGMLIGL